MIGILATGLTWLRAFKGPCLILAVVAGLAGASLGFVGGKRWEVGNTLTAQKALSDVLADMATQAAAAEAVAAELRQNALQAIRERDHQITSAVDGIPAKVAQLVAPKFAQLRSALNDPAYDCIRTARLPESYLDGLRRPGGRAAAEDHPDTDPR